MIRIPGRVTNATQAPYKKLLWVSALQLGQCLLHILVCHVQSLCQFSYRQISISQLAYLLKSIPL